MSSPETPFGGGLPPLSLYVHLPWCVRKCPYCDFNSHALKGELPAEAYLEALLRDLEQELPLVWGRRVHTVYFGGGTPSLFSAEQMGALLEGLRARIGFAPGLEITLEANPGTIERDSFRAYRDVGINRVSLGAQSFDAGSLAALGRVHGPEEIHRSVESLHAAGLENFNMDLMYGLPGQSVAMALSDLDQALATNPAHLSHYQLTLEPNTAFAASPPTLPDDEVCWSMQEASAERLEGAGFSHYEVSAWCQPERESRHNLNYWGFGDYLGIGAGAHGKLTLPAEGRIRRRIKTRHPKRYLAGDILAQDEAVPAADLAFEFFLNVLRLRKGFTLSRFSDRTGLSPEVVIEPIRRALDQGLLEPAAKGYRPTELGWRFSNDLQALFLPEEGAAVPEKRTVSNRIPISG
ncbi:MAG: radical SAM family heme chaperone HemW [Pseudomonadota bacterium]